MKLIDCLRQECILTGAKFQVKEEVLETIAQVAKKSDLLKKVDIKAIVDGLKERESLGSTGFGQGIAIPHCRLKSVKDFVVGIITAPEGVEFEAIDEEKVKLIIFIIAPEAEANKQIKLLSKISQALHRPGAIQSLLAEVDASSLKQRFLSYAHTEIPSKEQATKSLINIFIQDEKVFHEVLELLTGVETSHLVVLEAENTAVYLAKIPLFAGLWSDQPRSFSRVIVVAVDKGLINETIRRVESITGDLDAQTGVLITAHDLTYSAGSIGQ
ncbi:MAG: PTS sugar transporter subunit IIA [Pseudomonadota bacterium]